MGITEQTILAYVTINYFFIITIRCSLVCLSCSTSLPLAFHSRAGGKSSARSTCLAFWITAYTGMASKGRQQAHRLTNYPQLIIANIR